MTGRYLLCHGVARQLWPGLNSGVGSPVKLLLAPTARHFDLLLLAPLHYSLVFNCSRSLAILAKPRTHSAAATSSVENTDSSFGGGQKNPRPVREAKGSTATAALYKRTTAAPSQIDDVAAAVSSMLGKSAYLSLKHLCSLGDELPKPNLSKSPKVAWESIREPIPEGSLANLGKIARLLMTSNNAQARAAAAPLLCKAAATVLESRQSSSVYAGFRDEWRHIMDCLDAAALARQRHVRFLQAVEQRVVLQYSVLSSPKLGRILFRFAQLRHLPSLPLTRTLIEAMLSARGGRAEALGYFMSFLADLRIRDELYISGGLVPCLGCFEQCRCDLNQCSFNNLCIHRNCSQAWFNSQQQLFRNLHCIRNVSVE